MIIVDQKITDIKERKDCRPKEKEDYCPGWPLIIFFVNLEEGVKTYLRCNQYIKMHFYLDS